MINEELKTFISKMRAAGKTDPEITAELKVAGWEEGKVNQHLLPKTNKIMLGLRKMKFWIWLYGISVLLFVSMFAFGPALYEKNVPLNNEINIVFATFISLVLPIFTFLAILSGTLNIVLSKVFPSKNIPSISHGWLMVIASAISGIILALLGILMPASGNLSDLLLLFFPIIGMFWLIFSLINGVVLSVKIILRREIGNRRRGWISLFIVALVILITLFFCLVLSLRFISTKTKLF